MSDAAYAASGKIPGVGRRVTRDLWDMGFRAVEELRDRLNAVQAELEKARVP